MHELSIAQSILEIVKENAGVTDLVKHVKVRIGELANVVPDSLEFCFGAITMAPSSRRQSLRLRMLI